MNGAIMSITVIVEFNPKPEYSDILKDFLAEALPDTRAYDGCISLDTYNNSDSDGNIVLIVKWESREHQERYLAWRVEQGAFDKLGEMLSSEVSIRYFEKTEI